MPDSPRQSGSAAASIVLGTAEPAFAVDQSGRISTWNPGMEQVLGHRSCDAVGADCGRLLGGTDLFGNRFCGENCPALRMARRGEPVHRFELDIKDVRHRKLRVCLIVSVLRDEASEEMHLLHFLDSPTSRAPAEGEAEGSNPGSIDRRSEVSREQTRGRLTPREREILQLLDRGQSTREIAEELYVSVKTVRNHIQNILNRLGAHSRLEALAVARRDRLV